MNNGSMGGDNKNNSDGFLNSFGDVIGVGVNGDGNVIGKNITIGSGISVNKSYLDRIDPQFSSSIKEFEKILNEKIKEVPVSEEQKKTIMENVEKLANEVKVVKPDQIIQDENIIDSIKSYMVNIADKIFEISPSIAESVASVTPLAPFSKVIGKGVGFVADRIKKKLDGN